MPPTNLVLSVPTSSGCTLAWTGAASYTIIDRKGNAFTLSTSVRITFTMSLNMFRPIVTAARDESLLSG